jgi:mannose-6-phosphate isomerase-like protein (cupin superfamily)
MKILSYEFENEGMSRVYENEKWMVGVKNWKPANDITGIDCLERHNQTDELFVLLSGECVLLFANETESGLKFETINMEPNKVYNIPQSLWHNTITMKDTKLVIIEDSSTSMKNSELLPLTEQHILEIQELVKEENYLKV